MPDAPLRHLLYLEAESGSHPIRQRLANSPAGKSQSATSPRTGGGRTARGEKTSPSLRTLHLARGTPAVSCRACQHATPRHLPLTSLSTSFAWILVIASEHPSTELCFECSRMVAQQPHLFPELQLLLHRDFESQNLISYGWGRIYVHAFIVGHTGVMGQANAHILQELGVSFPNIDSVLANLAVSSLQKSCAIRSCFPKVSRCPDTACDDGRSTPGRDPTGPAGLQATLTPHLGGRGRI